MNLQEPAQSLVHVTLYIFSFIFSALIALFIHNYIEYSVLLALKNIFNTLVLV